MHDAFTCVLCASVLNAMSVFSEVYEVIGTHQLIKVLVGEDVVLPCHVEPPLDVTSLTIEWRLKSVLVHVYRNWQDDDTLQHVAFKGRTSLFHNKMKTGNISLKISSVYEADEGNYMCSIPKLDSESRRGYTSLIVSKSADIILDQICIVHVTFMDILQINVSTTHIFMSEQSILRVLLKDQDNTPKPILDSNK